MFLSALIWMIYYSYILTAKVARPQLIILYTVYGIVLLIFILLFRLSYTKFYRIHTTLVSLVTVLILCGTSLIFTEFITADLFSPLCHFCICIESILLIYTMIPLRLWQNCSTAAIYSILFEIGHWPENPQVEWRILTIRIMLHLCVHLVGYHTLIINVVRMRGTFIEVGQNLLVKRQLEMEKQVKIFNFKYFIVYFYRTMRERGRERDSQRERGREIKIYIHFIHYLNLYKH